VTPTQRSLAHLRREGYEVAIVEHWNSFIRRRQDLFGIIDLLAVRAGETLAVQTTSGSNVSARVKKIAANEYTDTIREANVRLEVHGWAKRKVKRGGKAERWHCRIVDVS